MSDGRLTDAELEAIRARLSGNAAISDTPGPWGAFTVNRMIDDQRRTLAALDAALTDLAVAEGALHDLTSPESPDGNRAYLRGVEAGEARERARCAALLRLSAGDRRRFLPQATPGRERLVVVAIVDALTRAAAEVESPPAPAAARKEE